MLSGVMLLACTGPAFADNIVHDRKRFFAGAGGGVGFSDVNSVVFSAKPNEEVGFKGDLRFGWGLASSWAVSVENALWWRSDSQARGLLSNHDIALTYFLRGWGLYGRAGVGLGRVDMQWEGLSARESGNNSGLGYMFAVGNEWRVNYHMAIMWQASVNVINVTPGVPYEAPLTFSAFTVQLNWYSAEQRPR